MLTIIDALTAEHRTFTDLFDLIESLLPGLSVPAEVKLLSTLVERLLQSHADTENNLAYAALDHVIEQKGHSDRLHQDHKEIDESFRRVQSARNVESARRLLKTAIAASRIHFRREEQSVFPLIERTLRQDTLAALGSARVQPRVGLAG